MEVSGLFVLFILTQRAKPFLPLLCLLLSIPILLLGSSWECGIVASSFCWSVTNDAYSAPHTLPDIVHTCKNATNDRGALVREELITKHISPLTSLIPVLKPRMMVINRVKHKFNFNEDAKGNRGSLGLPGVQASTCGADSEVPRSASEEFISGVQSLPN